MESDGILCYLCKKNGKRCTGCRLIAYCGVECQRKDWKYHRKSCGLKPTNVMDSLINNRSFQHMVSRVLLYLSAKELQAFRCTKRSWRDAIATLWKSKTSRKFLDQRLECQWLAGEARTKRTVYEGAGFIERIAADQGELLMEVKSTDSIHVLDATNNYNLKYKIPKNSGVWLIHKDFVLVEAGNAFNCLDRHSCKQIDLGEFGRQIQIGEHGKNVKSWDNKEVERCNDKPVSMKLFGDVGFIVYRSNLVVKFLVHSPYQGNDIDELNNAETKFVFKHIETFEELLKAKRTVRRIMLFNSATEASSANGSGGLHNIPSDRVYSSDNTVVYAVQGSSKLLIWHLEKKTEMYTIEGVDDLLDVYRDSSLEYIVLSRNSWQIAAEELEELYGDFDRENWEDTPHLQIWSHQKFCRTMLVPGLSIAKINPRILAVSSIRRRVGAMKKLVKGEILLWNTIQVADRKTYPESELQYIKRISMDEYESLLHSMLFLRDRFIWCEVLHPLAARDDEGRSKELKVRVKEMNFWYC